MNEAAQDPIVPTILVVEDDDAMAKFLVLLLERDGYAATLVRDGLAAVELLESGAAPDLILLDLMLPGWRGDVVADCARAAHPDVPLIFMSGNVTEHAFHQLPPRSSFLAKPFTVDDLRRVLTDALAGR